MRDVAAHAPGPNLHRTARKATKGASECSRRQGGRRALIAALPIVAAALGLLPTRPARCCMLQRRSCSLLSRSLTASQYACPPPIQSPPSVDHYRTHRNVRRTLADTRPSRAPLQPRAAPPLACRMPHTSPRYVALRAELPLPGSLVLCRRLRHARRARRSHFGPLIARPISNGCARGQKLDLEWRALSSRRSRA